MSDRDHWRDRPVLVTGATGFVGSHLTAGLVDLGADVVVLERTRLPATPVVAGWAGRVTVVEGPLESLPTLERALNEHEIRTVFHLAAQSQVGAANRNPLGTFHANVEGTWNVLEAARRTGTVEAVVTASSDKAYGSADRLPYDETTPLRPVHPYDVSKACADLLSTCYAETYGLPVAVTRCGNFFGPGDTNWARLVPGTIRSLLRGEPPVIRSDGTMVRDYLYVLDGVGAYTLLAERLAADASLRGRAYNFSLERPTSVLELVGLLQRAAGTDLDPKILDEANHEIPSQWLSAERARTELGWAPSGTLEDALAATVAWYRRVLAG